MINKDEFFREVTIRICSSLEITTALGSAFDYLREIIPLDTINLSIRDETVPAIRILARIGEEDGNYPDNVIPVSQEFWKQMLSWRPVPSVMGAEEDEHFRLMAPFVDMRGNSKIFLPLRIDGRSLGALILCACGEGRYTPAHVDLLATVAVPFAIAMANALSFETLTKCRDRLLDDNLFLNRELVARAGDEIVGSEVGLRHVMEMVRQVAPLNNTVLLLGETGTGKEMVANAIHAASPRKDGPFIKVNCGAIPESLVDSELFGHEKGAYTGAVGEVRGRFERADGGTIFLDEVGELPLPAQVRLLRVLQNREIERVGGTRPIPVDLRVIAATHRNLEGMIAENRFREDLWFRLNVFPIVLPPLRQRVEDIPALTRYFISKKSLELGLPAIPDIVPGAVDRLLHYGWPGNVRELENLVERELILRQGGRLRFDGLPRSPEREERPASGKGGAPLTLEEAMAVHLGNVLEMAGGKIYGPGGAAELLGVKASTLRWRLDKLGIKYRRGERMA
ncbi:sigma-54-dependent Fis family transcriptional regulator [Geobacter sp. FeAm09]|nr:sigma-54-dependent Fis family transcriptional regulator [Geobacter sp. FeAm09]